MERPPWRVLKPAMSHGGTAQVGMVTMPGVGRGGVLDGGDFGMGPWRRGVAGPAVAGMAAGADRVPGALRCGILERLTG